MLGNIEANSNFQADELDGLRSSGRLLILALALSYLAVLLGGALLKPEYSHISQYISELNAVRYSLELANRLPGVSSTRSDWIGCMDVSRA